MAGVGEQRAGRALFDDASGVHDDDLVDDARHDAEIVGHPHHGHARAGLDVLDQLEDLLLDRDVERGRRFVGDEQAGRDRQRHGDHDALEHPTGELVGKGPLHPFGLLQADLVEDLAAAGARRVQGRRVRRVPRSPVGAQGLDDLGADPQERVERRHRVLVDHGDLGAPDAGQASVVEGAEILAGEGDLAPEQPHRRVGQQPQHGQHGEALA